MSRLYKRSVSVIVRDVTVSELPLSTAADLLLGPRQVVTTEGLEITGLRVAFKVTKKLTKDPNTASITVTNLSEASRNRMKAKGASITLLAGYGDVVQRLFSGNARRINHQHERPEWTTTIDCGDGETAFLFSRISQAFPKNTSVKDLVLQIGKKLVKDVGNLQAAVNDLQSTLANGFTAHGRTAAVLDKALKGTQLEWSIQDGRLQLLGPTQANTDPVTVFSSDTGLVGSPEFSTPSGTKKPEVLKAKILLQPQIRPGSRIRMDSESIKGVFKVTQVEHTGDTAGSDWFTEVEALPYHGR